MLELSNKNDIVQRLVAEARRQHTPHGPVDWHVYENLKHELQTQLDFGPEYDTALRQILDGLECGE